MKKSEKKYSSEKGVVLITVLSLSFILLAMGIVLMQEAFYHMGSSVSYTARNDALLIAEYGINRAIYELEEDISWTGMTDTSFGHGKCTVTVDNNFSGTLPKGDVPANSILVTSTGEVEGGRKKTVVALLTSQLVPYTAISDGRIILEGTNSYTFKANSIPGFEGKFHSNYDANSPSYNPSKPYAFDTSGSNTLDVPGINFSTSGSTSSIFETKVESSQGTVVSPYAQKDIPAIKYSSIKPKNGLTGIGDNVPAIGEWLGVEFDGKLKNDDGTLKAWCKVPLLGHKWLPVTGAVDALPDGMKWNKNTATLTIEGNRKYYRDGDLSVEGITLNLEGKNSEPSIYVDGTLKLNNIYIEANKGGIYAKKGLVYDNTTFQTGDALNNKGGEIFTEGDFIINTPDDKAPAGGNYIEGCVYAGKRVIINNQCLLPGTDNSVRIEGIIMAGGNGTSDGFVINNTGSGNFSLCLTYNPYLAGSYIKYKSDIQLQPVFWQVK